MSALKEQVTEFLISPKWTDSEKWVIKWQFRQLSHFQMALAMVIQLADDNNLEKLHLGFPIQVMGFMMWSEGDLGERLREAGLEI